LNARFDRGELPPCIRLERGNLDAVGLEVEFFGMPKRLQEGPGARLSGFLDDWPTDLQNRLHVDDFFTLTYLNAKSTDDSTIRRGDRGSISSTNWPTIDGSPPSYCRNLPWREKFSKMEKILLTEAAWTT
jgi:hypothetical protein